MLQETKSTTATFRKQKRARHNKDFLKFQMPVTMGMARSHNARLGGILVHLGNNLMYQSFFMSAISSSCLPVSV